MSEDSAADLAAGKILGWFQGGSEIGPRALGNRSILCAPAPASMKDYLNDRVKHRESFRPFAPSIPLERAQEYFDCDFETPFMLFVVPVRPEKRELIPAVCHVDGTARLQTVRREHAPMYHRLHYCFARRTGVPVLLNTSFNVAGEPIVETPADAVRCFQGTHIDVLYLHNMRVAKPSH